MDELTKRQWQQHVVDPYTGLPFTLTNDGKVYIGIKLLEKMTLVEHQASVVNLE